MPDPVWTIDPTTEDAGNTQLVIVDNTTYFLVAQDLRLPEADGVYASSVDVEGELPVLIRHRNRTVTLGLEIKGATASALETALSNLQQKLDKLRREQGTLKYATPSGDTVVFDVLNATYAPDLNETYTRVNLVRADVIFDCKPYARGPAVTLGDHTETTLPHIVFADTGVTGDVPALGRLVVDEDQAQDQLFMMMGVQSRYYDAATSAALFYEAEGRTLQGGATVVTHSGGGTASGGGTNNVVQQATLIPTYQSMLSTQAVSAGAHLSHVGDFHVWARVFRPTGNTGVVSLALEWSEGDFRRVTRNAAVTFPADSREGDFVLVDLGLVTLSKVPAGTQRWEGRFIAKSTVTGDDLEIDCFWLIPATEGYGEVRGTFQYQNPTSFSARDEFDQTAGNLDTPKALPVGGNWSEASRTGANGFAVETTGKTAQRTTVSDADINSGSYAIAGATNYADIVVQANFRASAFLGSPTIEQHFGVLARYTDTSNWLMATARQVSPTEGIVIVVRKRLAGTVTTLASVGAGIGQFIASPSPTEIHDYTIRLQVSATGRWWVWFYAVGSAPGDPVASGFDSDLVSGTLSTGKPGMYDVLTSASASTRNFDNFIAFVPIFDAAAFASQSLEWRNDRVIREDSGGTLWVTPSKFEGDYLLIPPAGREGRTARIIVKASRNDPDSAFDNGIDDISARLTFTPRYLAVPE